MRIRSVAVLTLVASSALAVSACGGLKQGIGLTKVVPDEFVTVVNGYGPQTPRRMTKSDVAFEKQLVKKKP